MLSEFVSNVTTERPLQVVAVFLILTAIFAGGMTKIEIQEDLRDFVVDTPEYDELQELNNEFGDGVGESTVRTWIIHDDTDVLSKGSLLRMLKAQERTEEYQSLHVTDSVSAASLIATNINPSANSVQRQIQVIERATPSEISQASSTLSSTDEFERLLSEDYNKETSSASSGMAVLYHSFPGNVDTEQVTGSSPVVGEEQERIRSIVSSVDGDMRIYGFGIMQNEFERIIPETLILLLPIIVILILASLTIAFRDLYDVLLGSVSLLIALIWTLGLMGILGIPFTQLDVAIPPMMLAVGVDFSIHMVNRYREEKSSGDKNKESMKYALKHLAVAFGLVTATTSIGFFSNLTGELGPTRDFGFVAGMSIAFVALVFAIFFPAAKLLFEDLVGGQRFSEEPLGHKDSTLGKVLSSSKRLSGNAPAVLLIVLTCTVGLGYYATGVNTSFDEKDFLPPEDTPGYVESLPEPMTPSEYTTKRDMTYISENFNAETVAVPFHIQGRLTEDYALESMEEAQEDPPEEFISSNSGGIASESILSVIESYSRRNPEFRRLVERNDLNGNGVPDNNLEDIYDALLESSYREQALAYMSENKREAVVRYYVSSDSSYEDISEASQKLAENHRLSATPTGDIIIYSSVSNLVLNSAFESFLAALVITTLLLITSYYLLGRKATLGVANTFPIVVTSVLVIATMRFLGIPFNALTATILAVTVGVGVDYSVHITHRFAEELNESNNVKLSLERTLRGTGGALTGSLLTTVVGTGALVISVTPILKEFGLLMVISIIYSYATSILVLPPTLVLWERFSGQGFKKLVRTPQSPTEGSKSD